MSSLRNSGLSYSKDTLEHLEKLGETKPFLTLNLLPYALTDLAFNLSLTLYFNHQLSETATKMGYENVGQIHPDASYFVDKSMAFYKFGTYLDVLLVIVSCRCFVQKCNICSYILSMILVLIVAIFYTYTGIYSMFFMNIYDCEKMRDLVIEFPTKYLDFYTLLNSMQNVRIIPNLILVNIIGLQLIIKLVDRVEARFS